LTLKPSRALPARAGVERQAETIRQALLSEKKSESL
jgi:hypothetical protein